MPGYSYVLGMHAFGLEEMNQYAEAEATARTALALSRKDGWAVHAVVHVMEMQGRIDEGIEFLASRERDWAPDNAFAFHNFWHLALFHMDGGALRRALALYDARIHPEPAPYVLSLIDATALLWRLTLEGVDVGERFASVADEWQARARRGAAASTRSTTCMRRWRSSAPAATRRSSGCGRACARGRGERQRERGDDARRGTAAGAGLAAFGRGRTPRRSTRIEPVRDIAHRFGGSHAQRDLITLTLIEAALRSGEPMRARHYIAERLVHKPEGAGAGASPTAHAR